MARREPVEYICRLSDYGIGEKDGPEIICCVDGRQLKIHEVWTFGEEGVTPEVHPNARIDVGNFVDECFANDYLTRTWRRIHMFGRDSINGSFKWIGVPNFVRDYEPPWTLNILAPYANWGDRGSSTSPNLGSGSGEYSDGVSINWNCPARVLLIYHRRIFENTRSAAGRARDNLLMENHTYRMQSPSTCRNPIRGRLVNLRDEKWDDCWDLSVCQ